MWSAINWLFGSYDDEYDTVSRHHSHNHPSQNSFTAEPSGKPNILQNRTFPPPEPRKIRWIFIGLGDVAWTLAECIATSPDCQLVGVSHVEEAAGHHFAIKYGVENWHFDVDDKFPMRSNADVAFVSGSVEDRCSACSWAIDMDWHILVENPVSLVLDDAKRLFVRASVLSLRIFELFPGRFCPAYGKLKELVRGEAIGKVSMVQINFSPHSKSNEPFNQHKCQLAFLSQLASALRLISTIYPGSTPSSVSAMADEFPNGSQYSVQIRYGPCQVAIISCSSWADLRGEATIHGSRGSVHLCDPFWQPESFSVRTIEAWDQTTTRYYTFPLQTAPEASSDIESAFDSNDSPTKDRQNFVKADSRNSLQESERDVVRVAVNSTKTSEDGSLRGWVSDLPEASSFDRRSTAESHADVDGEGELDLGQAAMAAAASNQSSDNSDSDEAYSSVWNESGTSRWVSQQRREGARGLRRSWPHRVRAEGVGDSGAGAWGSTVLKPRGLEISSVVLRAVVDEVVQSLMEVKNVYHKDDGNQELMVVLRILEEVHRQIVSSSLPHHGVDSVHNFAS